MIFFIIRDALKIKKAVESEPDSKDVKLEGITIYLIITLFFINYFSANHFVGAPFWEFVGLIFAIHKNYFLRNNKHSNLIDNNLTN